MALVQLRRELRAVMDAVDPALRARVTSLEEQIFPLTGRVDAAIQNVNSVKGTLAQVSKREKLGAEDLAFLAQAVAEKLALARPVKAVP